MKNYYKNLNQREQWMVITAFTCLIIYLFYLFIYSTMIQAIDLRNAKLTEQKATLSWIENIQKTALNTPERQSVEGTKLLSLVAEQLAKGELKTFPGELQQTAQGDIQLTMDKVPYTYFMRWLWQLDTHYKITIKQLIMERLETVGLIKITLVISPY